MDTYIIYTYIDIYIYIYVERTFWVYFVPSPNSIISPPRSNRYIGAILKNKSLWLRNNFSMMNKSAWWEGAGGAANFWSFSSSHSPRKHSASQANCLDSACAHTGLVLKVEAGDRKWVPLEVRVEVKKVSDQQNSKLCEWNWRHSIEQERKSTVQTGLAQVHMGDLSVPSWDACKELRWAEIFKSPLPTLHVWKAVTPESKTRPCARILHTHTTKPAGSKYPRRCWLQVWLKTHLARVCQGRVRGDWIAFTADNTINLQIKVICQSFRTPVQATQRCAH